MICVADNYLNVAGSDLHIAREYLEAVASSNAEEAIQATELLKRVKLMMLTVPAGVTTTMSTQEKSSVMHEDIDTSMGS